MSKIVFLMIAAGLAAVAIAAIHINDVNARQQTEFIQVSVLAEHQADYGVDEQVIAIPVVSVDIIEDAARDFQSQSPVRVITYTALPTKEPRPNHEEQQDPESLDEIKHDNGQDNEGDAVETSNNGNGGSNPNNGNENNGNHGNGNNSDENKDKDKDKDNGNGGGGGNDKDKDNGNGSGNGNGNVNSNGNGNGNGKDKDNGNGNDGGGENDNGNPSEKKE
jgi:hypothetical protein